MALRAVVIDQCLELLDRRRGLGREGLERAGAEQCRQCRCVEPAEQDAPEHGGVRRQARADLNRMKQRLLPGGFGDKHHIAPIPHHQVR